MKRFDDTQEVSWQNPWGDESQAVAYQVRAGNNPENRLEKHQEDWSPMTDSCPARKMDKGDLADQYHSFM